MTWAPRPTRPWWPGEWASGCLARPVWMAVAVQAELSDLVQGDGGDVEQVGQRVPVNARCSEPHRVAQIDLNAVTADSVPRRATTGIRAGVVGRSWWRSGDPCVSEVRGQVWFVGGVAVQFRGDLADHRA